MAFLHLAPPISSAHTPVLSKLRPVSCQYSTPSQRQQLLNRIAPLYDNLNDLISLGQIQVWRRMTVLWSWAKAGDSVLDLCCGSGHLAFLLSEKVGCSGKVVFFFVGPFIHLIFSFGNDQKAINEKRSCYNNLTEWTIDNVIVPIASQFGVKHEYTYLKRSIEEFATGRELEELASNVGFSEAKHYEFLGGFMGNLVATR
ncbi:hypothetical protein AMTRI_Chr03g47380 [Amborella trichopoda]